MGSPARIRCDACNKRIRPNHHELRLSDPRTGQEIGVYHAGLAFDECVASVSRYLVAGASVKATIMHPDWCGPSQEYCTAGAVAS